MTSPAAKMCGADVRRYGSTRTKPRCIGLDARRREVQPGRVRLPADGHDRERRFRAVAIAVLGSSSCARRRAFSRTIRSRRSSRARRSPHSRNAEATAAEISSSSVGRMRGPRWKSCTREPNALKTEATCAPVAPAANHQHRRRHGGQAPGVAVRVRELESGDVEPPTDSARAKDEFFRLQPQPGRRFDRVRIDEPRSAGVFVHGHAQRIDLLAPGRMSTHVLDDLADAREQPRVVQHRLAHRDAVLSELSRLADQPGGVGQRPHGNRTVIGRHAAELVASDQRRRAPRSAARNAATHPAGPAPMTMTSIMSRSSRSMKRDLFRVQRTSRSNVCEITKRLEARQEKIGAAYEPS